MDSAQHQVQVLARHQEALVQVQHLERDRLGQVQGASEAEVALEAHLAQVCQDHKGCQTVWEHKHN